MSQNVVLVTIDSLRADHCGHLSDDHDLTPTLDRLARNGVTYEKAVAPGPRTPSSMPTVLTGEFGPVDRPDSWEFTERQERISRHLSRHETFAERLRAAGYMTVGITTNPWTSDFHYETSFAKGFDRWTDLISANDSVDLHSSGNGWIGTLDTILEGSGMSEHLHWSQIKDWFLQWPQYYEFLLDEVRAAEEPYFLWVFVLDPHKPYATPAKYRTENGLAGMYYTILWEYVSNPRASELPPHVQRRLGRAYRDTVRSVDGFLDSLVRDLSADDPAFVVHADHGEAFGDHGTFGHQQQLYEENLHVPLVVSNVGERARVSDPTPLGAVHDIVSSLADPEEPFDPHAHTASFAPSTTEDGSKASITGHRWKFITDGDDRELYDLRDDPEEQTNVLEDRPDVSESMAGLLSHRQAVHSERLAISRGIEGILSDV